jgi:hypothetical protein
MADLNDLVSLLKEQNKNLKELIEKNNELKNTPFDLTSLERLELLSKKVSESEDNFSKSLENASKTFKDLFTDKSNVVEDLKKATKELDDSLQDVQNEQKLFDEANQKLSKHIKKVGADVNNMTAKQKKRFEKLKDEVDKHKQVLELYEEKKNILSELEEAAKEYYTTSNDEQRELNKRIVEGTHSMDDFSEKWEQRTRALRKGFGEISKGGKQIYASLKSTLEPWSKANHEAMAYARNMGMSQKTADSYLSKTVSWAAENNIGLLFNKTTAELINMQGKYSEVLGRNVQLTGEQKLDMLAMEKYLGEDGMMDIAGNLESFGLGMSDSAEFVNKTMNEAQKHGIAASKLTKTIRENIKMAQNYSFKNGLDGLTSMAKKATELKTSMSLINGFIDKTSTVEGAITTGANLQVLGGSYAMGADPLSMMHESLNDVEGLFDRALDMVKGKVFYNSSTGNFEMGAMDRYLMKQAATQMGINPEELISAAFNQASLSRIENQIKLNSRISGDEDMVRMVKNVATWDNGSAVVNIDGVDKKVSDLNQDDKAKLEAMQRTDSQNLQDMAISLRSMNDIMSGVEKETNNEQANNVAVKWAASGINGLLRQNTELLNKVSKIGSWINVIGGAAGIFGGVWATASGVLRLGTGIGNLFKPGHNTGVSSNTGIIGGTKQLIQNVKTGGLKGAARFGKTALRGAGRSVVGGGLAGLGLSLVTDLLTGEFNRDPESSGLRAVGVGVGSAIGSIFGPIGTMVGGMIGGAITSSVQDSLKDGREEIRKKISSELEKTHPHLSKLFTGDNALQGNYTESQLKEIAKAIEDGKIDDDDNLGFFTSWKLRSNNDFVRIQEHGVKVNVEMAKGGYLKGRSHANGGMPILGSDISVEGGEFVVNKEATKLFRPTLEKINSGDYSMIAKEPLGKQLSVHRTSHNSSDMPHNSKVNINPISINLSGTIKLESNNKQVDISNDILSNPILINKLTEMINKQLNILDYNSYNKGRFIQKFT